MLKTTANKITVFRILLVPVFLVLCYSGKRIPALIVFLLASLSDLADGYIARHYNQISDFGKFMDPLADKILVMAAMCYFVEVGRMPGWALAIVLLREFAVSGMRLIAVEVKTAATMICLCLMLLIGPPGPEDSAPDLVAQISTAVILITTVYSGAEYLWKNRDIFRSAD